MEKKYTRYERKQIAEAFKAAVAHLNDGTPALGKTLYICRALEKSNALHWRYARGVVIARLEGSATLGIWLHERCGVPPWDLTRPRLQAHRHAWLQELIREFSQP